MLNTYLNKNYKLQYKQGLSCPARFASVSLLKYTLFFSSGNLLQRSQCYVYLLYLNRFALLFYYRTIVCFYVPLRDTYRTSIVDVTFSNTFDECVFLNTSLQHMVAQYTKKLAPMLILPRELTLLKTYLIKTTIK